VVLVLGSFVALAFGSIILEGTNTGISFIFWQYGVLVLCSSATQELILYALMFFVDLEDSKCCFWRLLNEATFKQLNIGIWHARKREGAHERNHYYYIISIIVLII